MQNRKKAVALNYDGANAPIVTAVGMGIIADKILEKAEAVINREKENIKRKDIKELLEKNLERLRAGERDLYL